MLGSTFTDWVGEQIQARNEDVTDKKEMNIELDADIAAAFHTSTSVSRKYRLGHPSHLFFQL